MPFFLQVKHTYTAQAPASSRPGIRPAAKVSATETPITTLRVTMGMLGGMRMPREPAELTTPMAMSEG